jgi:hypothetical protein
VSDHWRTRTGMESQELQEQLIREIDEARVRLEALEKQLAREDAAPGTRASGRLPSIDLEAVELDPAFVDIIPAETARKHRLLPLGVCSVFAIAMADPCDQAAIDEISDRTGFVVQPVLADGGALGQALDDYYGPPGSIGGSARPGARRNLRLVWSRDDSGRENPDRKPGGESSGGGRPAA